MIICKLWDAPYQYDEEGPWYLHATVVHENGESEPLDTDWELMFLTYTEALDFYYDFNSVEGGVRWGGDD